MRKLQFCLAPTVKLALVLVFALCAGSVLPMWGQAVDTGTVIINVTDQSGAVVSGASVKISEASTSTTRTGTTNDVGRYIFVSVPPGVYTVSVSKSGFSSLQTDKQEVTVGKTFTLNLALQVGGSSTVVEVTATGTELQTADATVGQTITGDTLDALPTIGRDVSSFVTLQPGVAPDGSVAGANQDQNSFALDGGNNSSDMDGTQNTYTASFAGDPTGGLINNQVTGTSPKGSPGGGGPTGVMPTPADSIEEFRVGTNNQTADFNSSAGAQVKLVTKRGQNIWHGSAYEYYLDNNWSANTFDNNFAGTARPSFHYSRFGGSAGGPLPGTIFGQKTYIFANYEGFRWPSSATITRATPSPDMQLGLLTTGGVQYNLNPYPVTNAEGAPVAANANCDAAHGFPSGACDPQGVGISNAVQTMWAAMPAGTSTTSCLGVSTRYCDTVNVLAFQANYGLRWRDDFGVFRLDHDFSAKWHFYATYRYYHQARATSNQVDITGGTPTSTAARPSVPWYATAAVTTNVTSTLTNDFRYSFLRNYWRRESLGDPVQVAGLGGALEPDGETASGVLAPLNLDTQDVRTRFWDGDDHMIRDDVSWIKGSHFITFGGSYQHNFNWHERTDNGAGTNYQPVYLLGAGSGTTNGMNMAGYDPTVVDNKSRWERQYGDVLGVPSITQISYIRSGPQLQLQTPVGTIPAFDKATIPYYNLYVSDSWRMKPSFTLTYGIGWALEMPPTEAQGKQVALVDPDNHIIDIAKYLNQRSSQAEAGQVYNPLIGWSLIGNVAGHPSNFYNPFYKGFSPRLAAAWNPKFDGGMMESIFGRNSTVIRGGYSVVYSRLNGVGLVLLPLLGNGLIQAVNCISPLNDGVTCAGTGGSTPANSFRVCDPSTSTYCAAAGGGLVAPIPAGAPTLPQPFIPGVNGVGGGLSAATDPNFRPSTNQSYDVTIQRQLNNRMSIEVGYIGRHTTHEFQPVNMNTVPYMMTLGGQRFDNAYGQMVLQYCGGTASMAGGNCAGTVGAVTAQPFFETALGVGSPYCTTAVGGITPANCTQAVALNEGALVGSGNIDVANVWSIWSDLDNGAFNFPRSMLSTPIPGSPFSPGYQASPGVTVNTSLGYANYNAMFASYKMSAWHGVTLQSNFTWSKSLGTGSQVQATSQYTANDSFDLSRGYGYQPWDRKFMYNVFFTYTPQVYKSQEGITGRLLGGWTFAPVIDIGSGLPQAIYPANAQADGSPYGGGQSFGAADATGSGIGAYENSINMCGGSLSSSRHNNPVGGGTVFGSGWYGPELYQDPGTVYNCFRNPILGVDNGRNGGPGNFRGQLFWNVDFGVKKDIMLTERFSAELNWTVTNIFNHNQMFDPYNSLGDTGDFGGLEGQVNNPRRMEIAFRFRF